MDTPIKIYKDNAGAIHNANSEDRSGRMQHIDTKFFFIREKLQDGTITIQKIAGTENLADMMTKIIRGQKLKEFKEKLQITSLNHVNVQHS